MFFKLLHTSDQSKQLCFNSYLNYVNRKAPGRLGKDIMLSAAFYIPSRKWNIQIEI